MATVKDYIVRNWLSKETATMIRKQEGELENIMRTINGQHGVSEELEEAVRGLCEDGNALFLPCGMVKVIAVFANAGMAATRVRLARKAKEEKDASAT